jgi:hypothetical protein
MVMDWVISIQHSAASVPLVVGNWHRFIRLLAGLLQACKLQCSGPFSPLMGNCQLGIGADVASDPR